MTKFIRVFLVLLPSLSFGAIPPEWFQRPARGLRLQGSHTVVDETIYSVPEARLVINPTLVQPKPESLELTFEKGTQITATTFEVGAGGRLTFRGSQLNRVCLICQPGGEIRLEGCSAREIYFSANNGHDGTAAVGPKVVLDGSTVQLSAIESPAAMGLTAKNSRFISTHFDATEKDGASSVPSYSECVFSECKVEWAELLMSSTGCWFSQCTYLGKFPAELGSYLLKPVLVRVRWTGISPEALPAQAGKVRFEDLASVSDLNATAGTKAVWAGSTGAPGRHLGTLVQLADADGILLTPEMVAQRSAAPPMAGEPAVTSAATLGPAFKTRQTSVNGLLISQLLSGEESGHASRMNLTALPNMGTGPSQVRFNQAVGLDMESALNEVSKFTKLRHNGWPAGHTVELGFEDKYIDKDGPSAAVACALLLEGAITGKQWDPAFAVTGDMNADGSVQPIGGVQAKIRGATKGSCKLVGVPEKNEQAVADILVLDGPAPLVGITVFGLKTFDDALLLAGTERPQALQNALTDFDNMRAVMMRDPRQLVPLLRTPQAAQRLRALLTAAPNCYSAKYLLLYLQNRAPRSLSIAGSIQAAQGKAQSILSAIDHDLDSNMNTLKGDEVGGSLNKLRQLRPLLDSRVWPYVDYLVAYGEVVRGSILNPVRSGARYWDLVGKAQRAAGGAKAAYEKLINDPQVREELGL